MAESPDVLSALLYVAQNTSPFNGSHALYSVVKFVRGYPLSEEVEVPTVALHAFGGSGAPKGLGTVKQWRTPSVRVEVLAENGMDADRIVEKLRDAWQRDYDCDADGVVGEVGTGYMRETGTVKDISFSEPQRAAWDDAGRVARRFFDTTVRFGD